MGWGGGGGGGALHSLSRIPMARALAKFVEKERKSPMTG